MSLLGQTIKEFRTVKKLSQEDIGKVFGVSRQAINQWEKGQTQPRIKRIGKLAELFGCNIQDLFSNNLENNI